MDPHIRFVCEKLQAQGEMLCRMIHHKSDTDGLPSHGNLATTEDA